MKLQTRIIILSSIVVLIAITICDITVMTVYSRVLKDEAKQNGYVESYKTTAGFNEFLSSLGAGGDDNYIKYYLKKQQDNYTVCCKEENEKEETECYNNTVFSVSQLKNYKYIEYDTDITIAELGYKDRKLIIFNCKADEGYILYHIVDLSPVYDNINRMLLIIVMISIVIVAVSVLFLYYLISKSLLPLQKLSKQATRISDGEYSQRIAVINNDEVGLLCENFNKMAMSVEKHTKALEDESQKQKMFMGNLTHELKTPLTAISGYAQTLRTVKISDEDKEESLHYIYEECKRLERLSKKMMYLLELDNGIEAKFEDIEISRLFSAAENSCYAIAHDRGIKIETEKTDAIINADFDLMTDVIINLTDNAIKASRPDSIVKLYTEKVNDGRMCIVIQDYGCGIPENEIEKILEPFYMVDKSRSKKNGGTGLGLSLTSLILKKHNMTLKIESVVDKGTRMLIYNSMML